MIALLLTLGLAHADGPLLECPLDEDVLEPSRLLRSLSLDLRGVVPDEADYARMEALGGDPYALVDEWLDTEAFADQVVRFHRALLWPNVSDIRLLSNRQRLKYEDGLYYRYLVAPNYRGGPVHCGDFEAQFGDDGELLYTEDADGYLREGWVWVEPYWDPENPIKVCAFEAQTAEVSPWGTECDTYDSRYDPYCGCGPNLNWCDTPELGHVQEDGYQAPVHRAIARDVELRVKRVIEQDLSYLELLTGHTAFVNGPLTHFYRYNTRTPAHVRFNELPVDPDLLPDLAFTDEDTWVEIELGPEHSGILTSPLYLMKYQTRRARANRYYSELLCQPFTPPDGGLEGLDNPDAPLDLTARAGCQYCHAVLEPAGAHWGRWGEYGAGFLEPEAHPPYDADCAWCAETGEGCDAVCSQYYLTDSLSSEEDPYLGWMLSYEFLEERHFSHVEEGPALLVYDTTLDGRLPRCVARQTAEWLMGREVSGDSEALWVEDLAATFIATDFSYEELVRAVVLSDNYRRAR
ncbi:MAG: hypothetical protein H6741_11720 [Alphaproteobacteria bacterium]|nr:hypothetical protein [Alphaproteobacteria bacterium]MCB9793379.1 hypothetical protein [Alphaproteobacteria bacterium]